MGFGGISVWQLLILLLIVVLLFGTSKLKSLGSDLGAAVKSFRSGLKDGESEPPKNEEDAKDKGPGGA